MSTWDAAIAAKATSEAVKKELAFAAAAIARRRPDLVQGDLADRLHTQGWLEWHGGSLRLSRDGLAAFEQYLSTHW